MRTWVMVVLVVLAGCKSKKSAGGSGSAGSASAPTEQAEQADSAAEPSGPAKSSIKGATYLAQLATHLETKSCTCKDSECFEAARTALAYDSEMDSELAPSDRTRNEWLKNRELGCKLRATEPETVKKMVENAAKTQKHREEALAVIAAPYSPQTDKPRGKTELERYEKLCKDTCACTTIECTQKLATDSQVKGDALVDMTEPDRERYANVLKALAACTTAITYADMAQYVRDP